MDLILRYPRLKDKIEEAREEGYTDFEIDQFISGRIDEARAEGYGEGEINDYLGITKEPEPIKPPAPKEPEKELPWDARVGVAIGEAAGELGHLGLETAKGVGRLGLMVPKFIAGAGGALGIAGAERSYLSEAEEPPIFPGQPPLGGVPNLPAYQAGVEKLYGGIERAQGMIGLGGPEAQQIEEGAFLPLQPIFEAAEWVKQSVLERTGDPLAAESASLAVLLPGLKGVHKAPAAAARLMERKRAPAMPPVVAEAMKEAGVAPEVAPVRISDMTEADFVTEFRKARQEGREAPGKISIALKVGEEVFPGQPEEVLHGQVFERIEGKLKVGEEPESGWATPGGRFVRQPDFYKLGERPFETELYKALREEEAAPAPAPKPAAVEPVVEAGERIPGLKAQPVGLTMADISSPEFVRERLPKGPGAQERLTEPITLSPVEVPGTKAPKREGAGTLWRKHEETGELTRFSEADKAKVVEQGVLDVAAMQRVNPATGEWYERVGEWIRKTCNLKENPDGTWTGKLDLAERLTRLFALYSQDNQVTSNAQATINSIYSIARGEIKGFGRYPNKTAKMLPRVLDISKEIGERMPGFAEKVSSFYLNIFDAVTGYDSRAVTIDKWMGRYLRLLNSKGKEVETFVGPQYKFARDLILEITDRYNQYHGTDLKPRQVQALLWDFTREGRQAKAHPGHDLGVSLRSQSLFAEAVPGSSMPEGAWLKGAPRDVVENFTREALDTLKGLEEAIRVPVISAEEGVGTWEGAVTPNVRFEVPLEGTQKAGFKEGAADMAAALIADAWGQDSVMVYNSNYMARIGKAKDNPNLAAEIARPGGWDADSISSLVRHLKDPDYLGDGMGSSTARGQIQIVNTKWPAKEFQRRLQTGVDSWIEENGIDTGSVKAHYFRTNPRFRGKEYLDGEEAKKYMEGLGPEGSSRVQGWRDSSGPAFRRLLTEYRERYGGDRTLSDQFGQGVTEAGKAVNELTTPVTPGGLQAAQVGQPGRTWECPKFQYPDAQKAFDAAYGIKAPSRLDWIRSTAREAYHTFHRSFKNLDPREFPAEQEALRRHVDAPSRSTEYAVQIVKGEIVGLNPEEYKLFSIVTYLPDLMRGVKEGRYKDKKIPSGHKNLEEMQSDLTMMLAEAKKNPNIVRSMEMREKLAQAVIRENVERGILDEALLADPNYYHHQVLKYYNAREILETGGTIKMGASVRQKKYGFMRHRQWSSEPYNTKFAEAEVEWLSQAIYNADKKRTMDILARGSITNELKTEAKKTFGKDWRKRWRELIPEGYEAYHPGESRYWYPTLSFSERVLHEVAHGEAKLVKGGEKWFVEYLEGGERKEIPTALAMGREVDPLVLPKPVVDTIRSFESYHEPGLISEFSGYVLRRWRQAVLHLPNRILRWQLNNTSGDADICIAAAPRMFTERWLWNKVDGKTVSQDLWNYYVGRRGMSARLKKWRDRDVIGSGHIEMEVYNISERMMYELSMGTKADPHLIKRYFKTVADLSTYRESLLRVAAAEYFEAKIKAGERPHGASDWIEMDGIYELYEKRQLDAADVAAKLSREMVGDYGNLSVGGRWLRNHLIPFYSWMEINAPRYYRLIRNMIKEEKTKAGAYEAAGRVARAAAPRALFGTAKGAAKFLILSNIFNTAVQLYNRARFPEEDRKMNTQRGQLHIILGKDPETGEVTSLRWQGAFSDALSWISAENYWGDIELLASGEKTGQEWGEEAIKGIPTRFWQSLRPEVQMVQIVAGYKTYPRLFAKGSWMPGSGATKIRDRGEEFARTFALGGPYRFATGKPHRGPAEEAKGALLYKSDPGETAYWNSQNEVREWLQETGPDKKAKSDALYNLQQAKRYKMPAEDIRRYEQEYYEQGGSMKGVEQSRRMLHPLAKIPKHLREEYVRSLSPDKRKDLQEAIRWWNSVYLRPNR